MRKGLNRRSCIQNSIGDGVCPNGVLNAEEIKGFWGDIWSVEKGHTREAECLKDLKNELGNDKHLEERVVISVVKVTKQCCWKMSKLEVPGKDGVQGYWTKNLSNLHEWIAIQTNKILMGDDSLPAWIIHGRTVLCQKGPRKGNAVKNGRPVMWKLLTGVIAEDMYDYLEQGKLLSEEQKGCRQGSRGIKDQLLIDNTVLKDCNKRHTNLSMTWKDYKKAYDFVLHSLINECMELFGTEENVRNFLEKSMEQWKLSLKSNGEDLGKVNVNRGIFQGGSLSPLLSVFNMVHLSFILRRVNETFEWGKERIRAESFVVHG